MWQPLLSAGTRLVFLQVFFAKWLLMPNFTYGFKPPFSQTSFQIVLWLWSGSGGPSCSHRSGPEFCLSAAADARDTTPFTADCQHNHEVLVIGPTENVFSYSSDLTIRKVVGNKCGWIYFCSCSVEHTEASTCPTLWPTSRWRTTCPEL